jgi:hypothetical protein
MNQRGQVDQADGRPEVFLASQSIGLPNQLIRVDPIGKDLPQHLARARLSTRLAEPFPRATRSQQPPHTEEESGTHSKSNQYPQDGKGGRRNGRIGSHRVAADATSPVFSEKIVEEVGQAETERSPQFPPSVRLLRGNLLIRRIGEDPLQAGPCGLVFGFASWVYPDHLPQSGGLVRQLEHFGALLPCLALREQ